MRNRAVIAGWGRDAAGRVRAALSAAVLVAAVSGCGAATEAERGADLFGLCTQCHGAAGEGSALALAPAIAGLEAWYVQRQLENFRSGVRGAHPDDLAGLRMHPMSQTLRDEQVPLVAAHVASLPPTAPSLRLEGGDASRGAPLYDSLCTICHGPQGEGVEAQGGPSLVYTDDWYLLSQLQKFKTGVRGADPADQMGILMRPFTFSLADEQAMKDVISHIMTLR